MKSIEECTTFAAVGEAVRGGGAIILKNRDAAGDKSNVVKAVKTPDGNKIVGISGNMPTSFCAGLNKYGVATASNNAAKDYHKQHRQSRGKSVSNRGQLMREILECKSASEAAKHIVSRLVEAPMEKPGILWIVDSTNIYVIEGGCDEFAVEHITNGIAFRSNKLVLLDRIENCRDLSIYCRYFRAKQLLEENYGSIDRQKMIEFSMDHRNGPGENSICRHSNDVNASVTISSAIMEIDRENAENSVISIALGKPCWAWRNSSGNLSFRMSEKIEKIPEGFLNGTVYKEFMRNDPYLP